MLTGSLELDGHTVPYLYGCDCADALVDAVLARCGDATSVLLVLDRNAEPHAGPVRARLARHVPVYPIVVDPTDAGKRLHVVEEILEHAVRHAADRSSLVLAMGGGFVGNVAGLAAALLHRGVRLVHLPTTPVAAFDSVLSLKQAVNLSAGKNLCGTYFPATLIGCDLRWLTTIPDDQLLTGVAEMAKNVLAVVPEQEPRFVRAIRDRRAHPLDALHVLCEIGIGAKQPLLRRDPRERGPALVFEYGHTVAHALEFMSRGSMPHGEAVAWGMLVAAEVSHMTGYLDKAAVAHHYRLVSLLELPPPREVLAPVDRPALAALLLRDNKRGYHRVADGEIPMVLLDALGSAVAGPDGRPLSAVEHKLVMAAFDTVAANGTWGAE